MVLQDIAPAILADTCPLIRAKREKTAYSVGKSRHVLRLDRNATFRLRHRIVAGVTSVQDRLGGEHVVKQLVGRDTVAIQWVPVPRNYQCVHAGEQSRN